MPESLVDKLKSKPVPWTGFLLAVFFALSLLSMRDKTLTVDEDGHWRYGRQILALDSDRFDDSKMPITALNAIPAALGSKLPPGWPRDLLGKLPTARSVTVLTAVLLGGLVFLWAREVYGYAAGILALFLFAFEPNIIAHSQLVTTDLYAAATLTLSAYTAWRYSTEKNALAAAQLGLALGLSQLAKYTNLALFLLVPLMLLAAEGQVLRRLIQARNWNAIRAGLRRALGHGLISLAGAILVINAGFLFNRTLTPLEAFTFESELFQRLQAGLSSLNFIRLPVPYPFVEGLDLVLFRERTGYGFGDIYMLGQARTGGFPGYYMVAFLFKTPLAIQAIFALALLSRLTRRGKPRITRAEVFLLSPILVFTIYFNFFYRAQIGIRYLLIIFPCMLAYSGGLVEAWSPLTRGRRLALFALGGYLLVSVASYFPHYIPYFNELVYDRRYAYRVLADSNIDWEQSEWYLARYLEAHPEAIMEPKSPMAGRIIMGVNALTGVSADRARYAWLRDNLEPVETIAFTYLVYDVSADSLERILRPSKDP